MPELEQDFLEIEQKLFSITEELKQQIDREMLEPTIRLLREYTNLEKLLGLDSKFKRPKDIAC